MECEENITCGQFEPPFLNQKKENKKIFPFYRCAEDIYAPCFDWEDHICFITTKGNIQRLKQIKFTKKKCNSSSSFSSSSSLSSSSSSVTSKEKMNLNESTQSVRDKKSELREKNKKQKLDEETYVKLGFLATCLCADAESAFWVFHPVTKAIVKVTKDKSIVPYLTEYENNFFNHITDITFDKENNTLYFVDSGNIFEENHSNLYFISEDTKTVLPVRLKYPFYVNSICLYQRNGKTILFACLTKENKIVRFIKKGNSFIKHVFRRFTGSFSPMYIATDNHSLLVLMKDLSGCYVEGKVLELQMNGQVTNAIFMKGSDFNGICYDPEWKKYFFIEKNTIYSY